MMHGEPGDSPEGWLLEVDDGEQVGPYAELAPAGDPIVAWPVRHPGGVRRVLYLRDSRLVAISEQPSDPGRATILVDAPVGGWLDVDLSLDDALDRMARPHLHDITPDL